VRFRNGYAKNAPTVDVEFKSIGFTDHNMWKPDFGEQFFGDIIIINLGKVIG
jgi:hypothetical protein